MNHFEAREGALWCEDVPLTTIAQAVGTPVYVYSTATLKRHYLAFAEALAEGPSLGEPRIAYAVKANGNVSVLATLARIGAGAETVSEGEIRRALAAGVPPDRIVFSGVGKAESELRFALETKVGQINLKSRAEFERLAKIAKETGVRPLVCLRVNPAIGAGGHAKITTGSADNKFGVSAEEAEQLYAEGPEAGLDVVGLACRSAARLSISSRCRERSISCASWC